MCNSGSPDCFIWHVNTQDTRQAHNWRYFCSINRLLIMFVAPNEGWAEQPMRAWQMLWCPMRAEYGACCRSPPWNPVLAHVDQNYVSYFVSWTSLTFQKILQSWALTGNLSSVVTIPLLEALSGNKKPVKCFQSSFDFRPSYLTPHTSHLMSTLL